MKHTTLNQFFGMVLIALCVSLATAPVTASAEDNPWRLRFAVISMDPSGTSVVVQETGERISYNSSSGTGFGIDPTIYSLGVGFKF